MGVDSHMTWSRVCETERCGFNSKTKLEGGKLTMCDCKHIATVCSGAVSKPPVAAWSHYDSSFIATAGVLPKEIAIWKLSSSGKEVSLTLVAAVNLDWL